MEYVNYFQFFVHDIMFYITWQIQIQACSLQCSELFTMNWQVMALNCAPGLKSAILNCFVLPCKQHNQVITAHTAPALEGIGKSCFLSTNTTLLAGLLTNGHLDRRKTESCGTTTSTSGEFTQLTTGRLYTATS